MTDPRDEKVAALERQLAEAAAQLAEVRADLAEVKGEPAVAAPPAQDLAQVVGPAVAASIREALTSAGISTHLPGFTELGPQAPTAPPARLSEPPRRVPAAVWLTAFNWRWWEAFGLVMVVTAPIAVWIFFPQTVPAAFIVTILVIAVRRVRTFGRRRHLLRRGKVATVTGVELVNRGTYFSGVTYNNQRVAQAHGWDVTRRWYSGPASTTRISYTVDGAPGELVLRGLPYLNGVILADPVKPSRALCVSSIPFPVQPDPGGELVVDIGAGLWVGGLATLLVYALLVTGAVTSTLALW